MQIENRSILYKKKERAKELYRLNREEKIKYVHDYRKKNADIIRIKKKIKYLENREIILKKQKEYYSQNILKIANRGKIYRKTHSESIRVRNRNRKNLIRSLSKSSDIDNKYLQNLIQKSLVCPICKKQYTSKKDKHIDHIKPLNIGGDHKKSNIRIICSHCNLTRPKDGRDLWK